MLYLTSIILHVLVFLVHKTCPLQSFGMQVDEMTGNIIKPYGMSPERFQQLQTLRVKEILEESRDKENKKEDEKKVVRRRKRSVVDSTLPAKIPMGFYKQDSLMINSLTSVVENTVDFPTAVEASLVKIGNYVQSGTITKLRFTVKEPTETSDVEIKVEKFVDKDEDGTLEWVEILATDAASSFSNFVKFASIPGAKVSDIQIGNNPKSPFNFVCVAISYKPPYPRTVGDDVLDIDVNLPMEYPEDANSILFRFDLTGDTYELKKQIDLQGQSVIRSYDAKDCEFWVFDGKLMLGIAHSGNTQTHKKQTRSLLYYQEKKDTATFVSMYPEEDDYTLATRDAVKLCHYEINGRSCVIFINNELSVTESPIFCYNFDQGKYLLEQKIKSFGGRDVATLSIHDTYPIHSHFFIIVCNYQESYNGILTDVSPTIYKYFRGRFAVFQTLPEINHCVDVTTIAKQGAPEADANLPMYRTTKFEHLVGFLHTDAEDFTFYQFDGKKFTKVINVDTLVPNSVLETVDMSTDSSSPNYNLLTYDEHEKYVLLKPQFDGTNSKSSKEKDEKLRACLLQSVDRIENQNFDNLHKIFLKAPTKTSLPQITVDSLSLSEPSSSIIKEAIIQSDGIENVEMSVEGLNQVDISYPESIATLDSQLNIASKNLSDLKADVEGSEFAKVGATNIFTGNLKFIDTNADTLTGNLADFSTFHVPDSIDYNSIQFTENMLLVDGPTAAAEIRSGHLIDTPMNFESIGIKDIYLVNKLNDVSIDMYVNGSKESVEITGSLTLAATNTFTKNIEAVSVNDNVFSASTVLLRSGDQTLGTVVFNSHVTAGDLDVDTINGVDLTITKDSVLIGDEIKFGEEITVNGTLTINGKVTRSDLVINTVDGDQVVDIDDLLIRHMRKSVENIVKVEHHYVDAKGDLTSNEFSHWPTDYVDSNSGELTFTNITFENIIVNETGAVEVAAKLMDRDDGYTISVLNAEGDLPFVSLESSDDPILITSSKDLTTLNIEADSTMSGTLQGFDLADIKEYSESGQKINTDNYEFTSSELKINGDTEIKNLKLVGLLKTKCSESCITNNVEQVYNEAIKLNTTQIDNANLHFMKMSFNQDVSVNDINDIDPENHFIELEGDNAKTLSGVNFHGEITFDENLMQSTSVHNVSACQLNQARRVLCNQCPEVTSESDKCEKIDGECVIKLGEEDSSLCATIVTHKLDHMWGHYKKENIIFHGGVEADNIQVNSLNCEINDVICTNIANRKMQERFTGNNLFYTTTILKQDVSITNLTVEGKVNLVDIDNLYVDTLFFDSTDAATVNNMQIRGPNFFVQDFTSNDISIGTTSSDDIKNRDNHVLNEEAEVVIKGHLNFNNLTVFKFDADTIEDETSTVDMTKFFNNKITSKVGQVLTGKITVDNDLTIHGHISKVSESQPKIDGLDLEILDQRVVRVNDSINLNNVDFEHVTFLNVHGVDVAGTFLGVDYPADVVTKTADNIQITGEKTFTHKLIAKNLALNDGSWKESTEDATPINLEKLFDFLSTDTLDIVKFMNTLTFDNEPSVNQVNGADLTDIIDNIWLKNVPATINFPFEVDSVSVDSLTQSSGYVEFKVSGKSLNLTDIKENGLSLTKDQSSYITLRFDHGLDIRGTLVAPTVTLRDDVLDKHLTVDGNIEVDIVDLVGLAVYKNKAVAIPMKLIIENVAATVVNMAEDILTNNVDLSKDAFTYKDGDVKTITNFVALTGDLNSDEFETNGLLQFNSDNLVSFGPLSHTGIEFDPPTGVISLTVADMIANAVDNTLDDSSTEQVSGAKTFSGGFEGTEVTFGKLNNLNIGDCSNPNILLTESCSGTPQVVTGTYSLANANFVDLQLTTLNGENFDDLEETFIYFEEAGDIVFSGQNTFSNGLEVDYSGLTLEHVYGLKMSELLSKNLSDFDMNYKPGVPDENVTELIEYIKTESEDIEARFLYASEIEWKDNRDDKCLIFSLLHYDSENPIQLLGIDKINATNVLVNLYQPSTKDFSLKCQANKLKWVKQFNAVPTASALDTTPTRVVSLPVNNTQVIVVLTGIKMLNSAGQLQSDLLPVNPGSQIGFGFISVHSIQVSEDGIKMTIQQSLTTDSTIEDVKSIHVGDKKCIVLCRGSLGVDILCLKENEDDEIRFDQFQRITDIECFSLSTTPEVGNENKDGLSFISVYTAKLGQEVSILKLKDDKTKFESVLKASVSPLTRVQLFSYKDGDEDIVLLTLLPDKPQKSHNIFKFDLSSNNFTLYETLDDVSVVDLQFAFDAKDKLKMYILRSCNMKEKCVSVLQTYLSRRYTRFSTVDALESIRVSHNANRFTIATHSPTKKKYAITRGNFVQHSSLHNYIYEWTNETELRKEFNDNTVPPPQFITLDCNKMVRDYLKELYQEPNYHLQEVSDFFLNVMPRGHVQFEPTDFTQTTSDYLTDPTFEKLLQPRAPVAAANMYSYNDDQERILFDDTTYVGTYLVYKGVDRVLYLYSRLVNDTDENNYRAVSFWTDCTDVENAEEILYEQYADVPPAVTADSDNITEYQCSMVHDVDANFCTKLKELDNKATAGAIVVHTGKTKDTPRFACGYLKKPVTAKLQFYRDHDEEFIKFDPYTSYTV